MSRRRGDFALLHVPRYVARCDSDGPAVPTGSHAREPANRDLSVDEPGTVAGSSRCLSDSPESLNGHFVILVHCVPPSSSKKKEAVDPIHYRINGLENISCRVSGASGYPLFFAAAGATLTLTTNGVGISSPRVRGIYPHSASYETLYYRITVDDILRYCMPVGTRRETARYDRKEP